MAASKVQVVDADNGHARLSRLAKAFKHAPTAAVLATLNLVSTPPLQIGEWPKEEWDTTLTTRIDELIAETHSDLGQSDSKYALCFFTAEGRQVDTKTFTERTRKRVFDTDEAKDQLAALDGSQQSAGMLAQQSTFMLAKLFMGGLGENQRHALQLTSMFQKQNTDLAAELGACRSKLREIHDAYMELRETVGSGTAEAPVPPAVKLFMEIMGAKLPEIVQALGFNFAPKG